MADARAVLFDYDDTLVKTRECKFAAVQALARRYYGFSMTIGQIEEHWGVPYRQLFARLFQELDPDTERVIDRYEALNDEFPVVAYEDALDTLEALLARQVLVGVVTSAGEIARRQMTALGLPLARLVLLQTAADSVHHKPDPRVFSHALALLSRRGVTPAESIYVGDSLSDYRAAHGAGLRFIGVHGRTTSAHAFAREGARSVASLRELTRQL